jgi:hypothetical protein
MVNSLRGEVALSVEGRAHVLRLSLGALAELEAALEAEGLVDLADRIDRGGLRATDVVAVLTAGFRGAGAAVTREEVAAMAFDGGAAAAAKAATALLRAAFLGGTP